MGHHISALVCKPSTEIDKLAQFDLPVLRSGEFVIIPMDAYHTDEWTERLALEFGGGKSSLILDGSFAHYIASIAAKGDYALIETDYFGSAGDQAAAVYQQGTPSPIFVSPRVRNGAINEALRLIGVASLNGVDEFDTLGLGNHRHFEGYFSAYYE